MEEKPDLEYLAHYGVKGMKWGVRKVIKRIGRRRRNPHAEARAKAYKAIRAKERRDSQGFKDLNSFIESQLSKPYDPNWVNNMYAFESKMQARNVNTKSAQWVQARMNYQYAMIQRLYL